MKKWFILLLAVAMVFAFAACGQEAPPADPPADAPADEPGDAPADAVDGVSMLKIGVIFDQTIDDGGWDESHYNGMLAAFEALGIDADSQVIIMDGVSTTGGEGESSMDLMIQEGCNVIFSPSSSFQTAVEGMMGDYPDVYFVQFEGTAVADNYITFSVADSEAIFVLGYVAAKVSESSELGFVAAQPQASVIRAVNAWTSGAKYANPEATVKVLWTNSWYDPTYETELVNALAAEGKTVIGYHGSTTAVASTCESLGLYCTGFHLDMHDYAPGAVLGSYMWGWGPIYEEALTRIAAVLDGSAASLNNEVIYLGIAEGCANVSPWNEAIVPADVIAEAEALYGQMVSGEVPAYPTPLNDNEGNQLLAEGETFTDMELQQVYVLIEGVIGDLP